MQLIHETNRVGVRVTGSTLLGLNHCPVRTSVTGVSPIDGFEDFVVTSSDTSGGLIPALIYNEAVPAEYEVGLYVDSPNGFNTHLARGTGSGSVVLYGSSGTNFVNFSTGDKVVYLVSPAYMQGDNHLGMLEWNSAVIDSGFDNITSFTHMLTDGTAYSPQDWPSVRNFTGAARGILAHGAQAREEFITRLHASDNTTPVKVLEIETSGKNSVYLDLILSNLWDAANDLSVFGFKVIVINGSILNTPTKVLIDESAASAATAATITAAMNGTILEISATSAVNNSTTWNVTGTIISAT